MDDPADETSDASRRFLCVQRAYLGFRPTSMRDDCTACRRCRDRWDAHASPRLRNLTRRPIAAQGPSLAISPALASTASRLRIGCRTTDRVRENPPRCRKQGGARRLNPLIGTTTIGRRRSRTGGPPRTCARPTQWESGQRGPSAGARAAPPGRAWRGARPARCLSRRGHPGPSETPSASAPRGF